MKDTENGKGDDGDTEANATNGVDQLPRLAPCGFFVTAGHVLPEVSESGNVIGAKALKSAGILLLHGVHALFLHGQLPDSCRASSCCPALRSYHEI